MNALYVLYDETCGFCCSCVGWLTRQKSFVPLVCLPAGAAETKRNFPLREAEKQELVAVDSDGNVYRDTDAFVMALWALRDWREWSLRLASPTLKPLARRVFELAGSWRHGLSGLLHLSNDAHVKEQLDAFHDSPRCDDGTCAVPSSLCRSCGARTANNQVLCANCLAEVLGESG